MAAGTGRALETLEIESDLSTNRPSTGHTLKFAEDLIHQKTETYCSELQRQILIAALQAERKTYDQLAQDCGYSPSYVKQDVAPKLWQLLSQVLDTKVTKANVRVVLEQALMQVSTPANQEDELPPLLEPVGLDIEASEIADTAIPKGTILLVDDQPQNLRLLSELLEEQGYEVQQAINGTVALQVILPKEKTAATRQLPDLILLDINMPEIDGYNVCQQIKAEPETRDIPVIFISALDEAWDKVKAFTVGGSDYISKPFKVVEVLARVENQLKIKHLQTTLKRKNQQLQQAIQELQRLAAIDGLTRVANRRRFDAYLLECWKEAMLTGTQVTLMFIELNHIEIYREGASVLAGDRTLQQLAQLIQNTVLTPQGLTCRYGTLTFAIILPQQPTAEGPAMSPNGIAQRLLQEIQKVKTPTEGRLTVNIGLATVQPTTETKLEALLAEGDRALQKAKQQRTNCIVTLEL